jgi:hypothetical protein
MIDYAPSRPHSRTVSKSDGREFADDREPARLRYEAYDELDQGDDEQSEGRSTSRPREGDRSRSLNNQSIR